MQVGDWVEVHTRFDDSWSSGFVITDVAPSGYQVMRQSDRSLLPGLTSPADLRIDSRSRALPSSPAR